MPNAKVLSEKQQIVAELAAKMQNATAGVLVNYEGITVELDTKLRAELRKNGIYYAVVKNTLTRLAAKQSGYEGLDQWLNGATAIAITDGDPVQPAKLLSDFAKKQPKFFEVKGGFIEGKVVDAENVNYIASLPSKEILIATVLGTLNAPIAALARAINAIAEQKGAPAETTEAAPEAPVEA